MKKLSLFFILIVAQVIAYSQITQPCLPEGIVFSRQSQIDSFPIMYPGCDEVEGTVTISEYQSVTDINDLSALSQLEFIGKSLYIASCDSLSSH